MLIDRVNVRDPPMMNIAACIVGMQRVGMRRTVAAVILIASDSASTTLCSMLKLLADFEELAVVWSKMAAVPWRSTHLA